MVLLVLELYISVPPILADVDSTVVVLSSVLLTVSTVSHVACFVPLHQFLPFLLMFSAYSKYCLTCCLQFAARLAALIAQYESPHSFVAPIDLT